MCAGNFSQVGRPCGSRRRWDNSLGIACDLAGKAIETFRSRSQGKEPPRAETSAAALHDAERRGGQSRNSAMSLRAIFVPKDSVFSIATW